MTASARSPILMLACLAMLLLSRTAAAQGQPWYDPDGEWELAGAPALGDDGALVTIVVFTDYECPFCVRLENSLQTLVQAPEFAGDVRLIVQQFPLDMHANARPAARAALAAHQQGEFWAYHEALFGSATVLSEERLLHIADELGLDLQVFNAHRVDGGAADDRIDREMALGRELGVRGTPNSFVNGRSLRGAQPIDAFEDAVREELAEMQALVNAGHSREDAMRQRLAANSGAAEPAAARAPAARPSTPSAEVPVLVPIDGALELGPSDALVTIAGFVDLQCPYSVRSWSTLRTIRDRHPDDVRLVLLHYPLAMHGRAEEAARAVVAAQRLGGGASMLEAVFDEQGALVDADFTELADLAGLDGDAIAAEMETEEVRSRVAADVALSRRLEVSGTPQFFINGYRLRGAQPLAQFAQLIERELARARALVEFGVPRSDVYDALQLSAQQDVVYVP